MFILVEKCLTLELKGRRCLNQIIFRSLPSLKRKRGCDLNNFNFWDLLEIRVKFIFNLLNNLMMNKKNYG